MFGISKKSTVSGPRVSAGRKRYEEVRRKRRDVGHFCGFILKKPTVVRSVSQTTHNTQKHRHSVNVISRDHNFSPL